MIKTVKVLGLSFLLLLTTSVNAESLGEISQYKELLTPKGVSGLISVTASGITNKDGILYLPSYKGGDVESYQALNGKIVNSPEKLKVHGRSVIAYQFENANSEVSLRETIFVDNLYKTKKAKIKYSHPGGVKKISYSFKNTSPVKILKYTGLVSVPKGYELYGVVTPKRSKKKKTYDLKRVGEFKVVEVSKSKVKPGSSVKFKIRIYSPSSAIQWTLWALVIFLSVGLLWKRRDILNTLNSTN